VIIGNPLGLEGTVSDGIVSAIRDIPQLGRILQVTAPISQGSSGGPVVNMFGEVVGVARGMLKDG
jgi:S1-C subfamily serine protease